MKDERTAKAIEEVFVACGSVSAFPVFNDGTELAPEVIAALECGMSAAIVAAKAIADGVTGGATPKEIAVNMKVTAMNMYVETVVFGNEAESEAENADE